MLNRLLAGLALAAAVTSGAAAQDLPKSQFKVIGLNSPTPVSIHDELPFWRKTIPEAPPRGPSRLTSRRSTR
jgi:TRAP-type transport system periplasmic protein